MTPEDERSLLQVRVLRLFHSLLQAGLEDVSMEDFHAFAFFAEALAPVWGEAPLGDFLKEEDGPHFPALQREVDRLVGLGLLHVHQLSDRDRGGRWRLDVTFSLDIEAAARVLGVADAMPDEDNAFTEFLEELAFGFAEIPAGRRDDAARGDAAWSAPGTTAGRFIELDGVSPQGQARPNHSTNAARHFQAYSQSGVVLTPAEQTSLYMGLMRRRAGA